MRSASILLVAVVGIGLLTGTPSSGPPELPVGALEPPRSEAARVAAHLARVERELLERDVSQPTPAQRAARRENLERLHEYRLRGVFPHNHDFPGERVPYFIDRHGIRCAMAFLIEQSGQLDLVPRNT